MSRLVQTLDISAIELTAMTKTKTATVATALWISLGIAAIAVKFDSVRAMPLNEIGDFLAGFFSPVAFLWLL